MSILQIFQNSYTNYHRIQCFVTNTKYFKLSSLLIIPYPNKALLKSNQTPHKSPKPKFVFLSWQNTQKHSNTILLPPTFAAPEPNPKTKKPLQKAHIRCKKKHAHTRSEARAQFHLTSSIQIDKTPQNNSRSFHNCTHAWIFGFFFLNRGFPERDR